MADKFARFSAWSLPGFVALLVLAFAGGAIFAHLARAVDALPVRVDRFEGTGPEPPLRLPQHIVDGFDEVWSSAVEGGAR